MALAIKILDKNELCNKKIKFTTNNSKLYVREYLFKAIRCAFKEKNDGISYH